MTAGALYISRTDFSRIEAAARINLPRESCGLLLGGSSDIGWRVTGVEESRNIAPDDRNDRFEVDPALLLKIQKAARAGGAHMIGVYHSHPNGGAEPSRTDVETSWQTGMIWVITAIDAKNTATRAYLREAEGFAPVPLQIMEME
ncbi:MAG: M67 family peptidase [Alphaproteobacteria bacterium]|nr:M67 family peptidase [Alphaproteobacteria bacterium]